MDDGGSPRDRQRGEALHGGAGDETAANAPPDMQALARDWITVWQSEVTAAASDRELQETWQTLAALWAGVASAMLRGLPRGLPDGAAGVGFPGARPAAPARPAPAAAASDARDAEVERLARRVAELERRLAGLEGDRPADRPGGGADRPDT